MTKIDPAFFDGLKPRAHEPKPCLPLGGMAAHQALRLAAWKHHSHDLATFRALMRAAALIDGAAA